MGTVTRKQTTSPSWTVAQDKKKAQPPTAGLRNAGFHR